MTADIHALTPDETARLLVEERVKAATAQADTGRAMAELASDAHRSKVRAEALAYAMQLQAKRGVAISADKIVSDARTFLAFLVAEREPPKEPE